MELFGVLDRNLAARPVLKPQYRGAVLWLIVIFLALRAGLAGLLGLGVDESYAVAVSRSYSLSFFDHPPLGFMLARFSADLFGSEAAIIVRLPYLLLFSASTWLLYRLTVFLYSERAGFWAAAWFSIAPFFFFSAGGWVVPDGPLVFFLLLAANMLARLFFAGPGTPDLQRWALLGLAFGGALLSKYQAVLAGTGALAFLLASLRGREILRQPGPYLAAAIALICFLPVILWNAQTGWISFAFQSGRAAGGDGISVNEGAANAGRMLAGQMLYLWPGPFLLMAYLLWRGLVGQARDLKLWFCLALALPAIVIFNGLAPFMKLSLPHWSMPGFMFLFPPMGAFMAQTWPPGSRVLRWNFAAGFALLASISIVVLVQVHTGAVTRLLSAERSGASPPASPSWDKTSRIQDWTDLRDNLKQRGFLAPGKSLVVARNWIEAGKVAYALGPEIPVLVLGRDRRHFAFLNDRDRLRDRDVILTTLSSFEAERKSLQRLEKLARRDFCNVTPLASASLDRGGNPYRKFILLSARFCSSGGTSSTGK